MKPTTAEDRKRLRTIDRALATLFGRKAFVNPTTTDDLRMSNPLARSIEVSDTTSVMLTDAGLDALRTIADTIEKSKCFAEVANYSDVFGACKRVYAECLADEVRPENAAECVSLIEKKIGAVVLDQTFAYPLYGVSMKDIPELRVGWARIVPKPEDAVRGLPLQYEEDFFDEYTKRFADCPWLVGSVRGTKDVAFELFQYRGTLVVGLLAVYVATQYERGSVGFRLGLITSGDDVIGTATGLSWNEQSTHLGFSHRYGGGQWLEVDDRIRQQLESSDALKFGFELIARDARNDLEEAIVAALFWFSDAQKDRQLVMQFVKLWSCVECFFSKNTDRVTQENAEGLASILVFGTNVFFQPADYDDLKSRIVKKYGQRSRALHHAAHRHVTGSDVAELSQWVAWMIVLMLLMVLRGYSTREQIRIEGKRIAATQANTP